MTTTDARLTPADHGQRMALADFELAPTLEGHLYELERGVVIVSEVPNPPHMRQLNALRRILAAHDLANPGRIDAILGGAECQIVLEADETQRHPDLAVYCTPPPREDSEVWREWIPELVIEVVSEGSRERDLHAKRDEYLAFGVREYWVVDADRAEVLVLHRRSGRWAERVVRPGETLRCRTLPGLELTFDAVFDAARQAR